MFRFQRLAIRSVRPSLNCSVTHVGGGERFLSTNMQSEGSALQKAFLNAVKPSISSSGRDEAADESSSSSSSTEVKNDEGTNSVNTTTNSKQFFPDLKSKLKKDEEAGENIELSTEKKMDLSPIQQSTKKYTSPSTSFEGSTGSTSSKVYSFQSPLVSTTTPPASFTNPATEFLQGHIHEFAPKIIVFGVGGGGCNAVNNMIARGLTGVDFVCANTDAQHLSSTLAPTRIQLGRASTHGLGCGANPEIGRFAADESRSEILEAISDAHMVFITAGMGGGTGTGAAPVVAEVCMEQGVLTVAVVTKPFSFEGRHRSRLAHEGTMALQDRTDTLIVIPNQNLFKLIDKSTSVMDAFGLADDVLLAGVKSITDLMVRPGLINLDFADVQSVMSGMGNAIMGTGQAAGEDRAVVAATDALKNPLLGGEISIKSAKGMLVNITGGTDLTLFEVDSAAQTITSEIEDDNANIIFGSSFDPSLEGHIRVSVVATGIDGVEQF